MACSRAAVADGTAGSSPESSCTRAALICSAARRGRCRLSACQSRSPMLSLRCRATACSRAPSGQLRWAVGCGADWVTGRWHGLGAILAPVASHRVGRSWGERSSGQRPARLLHVLDALYTQASLAQRSSGVQRRRERQRLALAQRLLDPLPPELAQPRRIELLFWRGLRWGTLGLLIAWLLRR